MAKDYLYIRADMNNVVATGHVMRCLSIADAAKRLGIEAIFITADNQAEGLLTERGYKNIILNSDWDKLESEISKMVELIKEYTIRNLLVDSYYVTKTYLEMLSENTTVTYIDDLNAFHYPVKNLICYANYYDKFEYHKSYSQTNLFLGCHFVPLREEFENLPPKIIKNEIEKVLLLSGGTDTYHILPCLTKVVEELGYEANVVCGRYNTDYEGLVEAYKDNHQIHILKTVDNLKAYMQEADVAISAGGSTLFELAACGTPTITYAFADNQLDNVKSFNEDKKMIYIGDGRNDDLAKNLLSAIKDYKNKEFRRTKSVELQTLVDGTGATNIVKKIFLV